MPSAVASVPRVIGSPRSITWAAHAAFFAVGIVTVLLGPMLPTLSQRWVLDYSQAGYLFSAQFVGATIGVTFSGRIIQRFGYRTAIIVGLGATSLGVGTLPLLALSTGLVAIACFGFAIGLMGPTCNLVVAELNPISRAAALNVLNFSWSVGAVSCPLLLAAAVGAQRMALVLFAIAGLTLILMLAILLIVPAAVDQEGGRLRAAEVSRDSLWSRPGLLVLCTLFFLYIGLENSVAGWLPSYAKLSGSPGRRPIVTSSFFYLALLVGRMMAPLILKALPEIKLARIGLGMGLVGIAGLLRAHSMTAVMAAACLTGLGLSSVFPTLIAILSGTFGPDSSRAAPLLFNMSNFGGATLPFLVGFTGEHSGTLRHGLLVPLVAAAILLTLFCGFFTSGSALRPTQVGA